jgi:hypothetical protein
MVGGLLFALGYGAANAQISAPMMTIQKTIIQMLLNPIPKPIIFFSLNAI